MSQFPVELKVWTGWWSPCSEVHCAAAVGWQQQQPSWLDCGISAWTKAFRGSVAPDWLSRALSGCLSHMPTQTQGHNLSPRWSINLIRSPSCQLAVTNAPRQTPEGPHSCLCMRERERGWQNMVRYDDHAFMQRAIFDLETANRHNSSTLHLWCNWQWEAFICFHQLITSLLCLCCCCCFQPVVLFCSFVCVCVCSFLWPRIWKIKFLEPCGHVCVFQSYSCHYNWHYC